MNPRNRFRPGESDLYNDPTLSDVKVKFYGQQIYAHKAILARRSRYFHKAFTGRFPVAQSSEINLGDEDNPVAVINMLRYLYNIPYEPDVFNGGRPSENTDSVLTHISNFVVADKYDAPTLRKVAA